MILHNSYLPAIHKIKRGENILVPQSTRQMIMATRLVDAGLAKWETRESPMFGNTQWLVPIETATPKNVQVSWWRTGARAGLYSQQAYPVLRTEGDYVVIELMGLPKHVKAEYTRKAA